MQSLDFDEPLIFIFFPKFRREEQVGPWHERCAAGSPKHDGGLGDRREARQLAWHPSQICRKTQG